MFYFVFVPHDLFLEESAVAHMVRAVSGLLDLCSTLVVLQQYSVTSKNIIMWAMPEFMCFKVHFFVSVFYPLF